MAFKKVDTRKKYSEMEKEIIQFWKEDGTFQKSVEKRSNDKQYSFYDGPPFITGVPHYGTLLSSIVKDAVPRYWTMKGFRVERRWGWDCHGLPAENMVEKKLGIKSKKEIEEKIGIAAFNDACLKETSQIASEWETVIDRIGRWVEFKNAYKTMDRNYMESVWWAFSELHKKGLIYEDVRVSLYCPRCSTPLSNFEIAMDNSYEMDSDPSVYVKMKLKGEDNAYFLVWTTTPWTLLANVALAVGKDIDYVMIEKKNESTGELIRLILAKERLVKVFGEDEYEIIKEIKGADLINKEYEPIFPHEIENGYRVIAGDFVTTEDGSGIVHIAPAFGEDDFNVRKINNLPIIMNVDEEGKFTDGEWTGEKVWEANDKIVKWLKENNALFKREQITHSYPHCHRCHTKLIYKAQPAWYVNVAKIRTDLISQNEEINWFPEFLKHGRFQNGIETAPDWNISRDRYFGTAIPVWKCENEECKEIKVIGSVDEVKKQMGNPNKFFLLRHGQAINNIRKVLMSHPKQGECPLTEKGRVQIELVAEEIKDQKIDLIFSSPLERTMETAQIVAGKIGKKIIADERLREIEVGKLEGELCERYFTLYPKSLNPGKTDEYGVEGIDEIKSRMKSFIDELNEKYQGKNIAIISHGAPLLVLKGVIKNSSNEEILEDVMPKNGELAILYSKFFDIHRPQIDEVVFSCEKCGGVMKRIPQVFDSWIESGSMPFAQFHYPFENKAQFEKSFPTDFISEYIAQTRAWFYVMHVLSVGIFGKVGFRNVVTTGTIAGSDGKKMSKSLGNYTLPDITLEKYSADALRFYLLSSPLLNAQNINFSEKAIGDIQRKVLATLWNSYAFLTLYAGVDKWEPKKDSLKAENLLDKWIISELNKLIQEVDKNMQGYDLVRAVKPFEMFIDNLSNWYIRRSRKRFWKSENDSDKDDAYATLHYVLVELAKLMAPFTPFVAEEIFKNLTGEESVHLVDFPISDESKISEKLNEEMKKVRSVISEGLQFRALNRIKVRQPLAKAIIKHKIENVELVEIMQEELNVKKIEVNEKQEESIKLDIDITPELKLEGQAREIVRFIQEMRKEADYEVDNRIQVGHVGAEEVFSKFGDLISKEILATELVAGELSEFDLKKVFQIEGEEVGISIKK